jgi:hypothetical protein
MNASDPPSIKELQSYNGKYSREPCPHPKRKMILLVFCLLSAAIAYGDSTKSEGNCVYTVYIRMGNIWKVGTNSNISLALLNLLGGEVFIDNLEVWGRVMGPSYDYFKRGNLEIFSG